MTWNSMRKIKYQFDGGGSHNGGAAGWGWAAFEDGAEIACGCDCLPPGTTNNEAEYTGLIRALQYAVLTNWGVATMHEIYGDSQLIVHQVNDVYETRTPSLVLLRDEARMLMGPLNNSVRLLWHPRANNGRADMLATEGRNRWTSRRRGRWGSTASL